MFTPGKLADEAQMGGLSRLLATKTENQTPNPYYSPTPLKFKAISNEYISHNILDRTQNAPTRQDTIRELQDALTETTRVFEEDFDEQGRLYRYGAPNDQFTNQDVIDQIVDKRYSTEDMYQRNWSDDEKSTKSGRSCKGKRYQEFMAVGGLIVNKRQRRDYHDKTDEGYNASCSWEPGSICDETAIDDSKITENKVEADKIDTTEASEPDNNAIKTFKAADFDLDAKIAALPSLSLEKFQQRKRENKRKKKTINLKPKILGSSHIVNSVPNPVFDRREMAESWRETVIGSQKRKPRKISITRLEINSMVSNISVNELKVSPEIKLATEAPCTVLQSMELCRQPQHSGDLLALATLAEVASHTSKLDDAPTDRIYAKASDENASKV